MNGLGDYIKITGSHFALMFDGSEALLGRGEFGLLQFHECTHLAVRISIRQFEHRVVQAMEAGQRDELVLVAHRFELVLEARDRPIVQIFLPVE